MAILTAEVLVADPSFKALTDTMVSLLFDQVDLVRSGDSQDRSRRIQRAERLRVEARDMQRQKAPEVPARMMAEFAGLIGRDVPEAVALLQRLRTEVGAFLRAQPEFETTEAPDLIAAVRGALERLGVQETLMAKLVGNSDVEQDYQRCVDLCQILSMLLLLLVAVLMFIGFAQCGTYVLIVPLFLFCMIALIAKVAQNIDWIERVVADCLEGCVTISQG